MRIGIPAIFASLLFAPAQAVLAEPMACLQYQPETVVVTGTLHRATFPGRPNYESVANGDEAETGFYLSLDTPICTLSGTGADREAFDSVREIQLVLNEKQYAALRPRLGKKVEARGQLFSAHTGHHHANVLMRVSE
ncbi:DUF4431 domain-containing protein [Pseudoduganella sp. FT93W]|uniref:DUF4431 domain-containing protein n=1 Tax=Duganella fentianensis TaxID=2692177 RepID=A0A845I0T9_9BURK|nr:DUF4431 domain-containing protein [Duganella fentianensis]MYN44716.1 DUF4431 domain-containing protein [Duganella fentianensis]